MSGFYCEKIRALKSGPQLYSVMNQALNEAPGSTIMGLAYSRIEMVTSIRSNLFKRT
jgi:hypothetical protein